MSGLRVANSINGRLLSRHLARRGLASTTAAVIAKPSPAKTSAQSTDAAFWQDPFAKDLLQQRTLLALDPRPDYRRVRMTGRHCGEVNPVKAVQVHVHY